MPFGQDPVLIGLVVVFLLFALLMYLFIRRTLTGLKEGFEKGQR